MNVPFRDRQHAGQVLAANLEHYCDNSAVIVLALPRGGVPVGFEVARALRAPLDVFIVRKLGFPGHEEYAMGAIATGGVRVTNPDLREFQVPRSAVDAVTAREQEELERRERLYRGDRRPLILSKRTEPAPETDLPTVLRYTADPESARD